MADWRDGDWQLKTLVFDYGGGEPGFADDGSLHGRPRDEDIAILVKALAKLGEATGEALDQVQVPPSQFTVEGHVALQVAAGLPTIVQVGVETGISVSMTWEFKQTAIKPFGPRRP